MKFLVKQTLAVLIISMSLPGVALAAHCDPIFDRDIGPALVAANGQPGATIQTFSEDCTGTAGCGDYFDITLPNASTLFTTFCSDGGTANFDTGISIWDPNDLTASLACNDDVCGLQSELSFDAPSTGVYRVRIGGFGGSSGTYTLAYSALQGVISGDGSDRFIFSPQNIPTISSWSQILLAVLLLLVGAVAVRRLRIGSR